MKRFIPVLALALILILTAWDDATSRRYPNIRIDEPIYDHPWGGDENNPGTPVGGSVSNPGKNDLTIIKIIKSWDIRFFFYGATFMGVDSRGKSTTTVTSTPVAEPITDSSSPTSQGGTD